MPNYQNTPIRQTTPEEEAALRRLSAPPPVPQPPQGMRVMPVATGLGTRSNIVRPQGPVGPVSGRTPVMPGTQTAAVTGSRNSAGVMRPDALTRPRGGAGNASQLPSLPPTAVPPPPVSPVDVASRQAPIASATGSRVAGGFTPDPVTRARVGSTPAAPTKATGSPGFFSKAASTVASNLSASMQPRPPSVKPDLPTNTPYERGVYAREKLGGLATPMQEIATVSSAVGAPNRRAAGGFFGGLVGAEPAMPAGPDIRDANNPRRYSAKNVPPAVTAAPPVQAEPTSPTAGTTPYVPYSPIGPTQGDGEIGRPLPPPGMVEVIRPSAAGGFQFTNELGGDIRPVGMDNRTAREFGGFRNAGLTAPDAMQGVEILRGAETNARQADAQMMQARAAQTEAQTRASALERSLGSDIFIPDANDMTKGNVGFVRRDANGQLVIEQTPITSYRPVDEYTVKLGYEETDRTGEKVKREALFNVATGERIADSGEDGAVTTGKQKTKPIAPPRNLPPEATTEWNQAIEFAGQYTNVESEMRQLAMDALRRKYPKLSDEDAEE